MPFPKTISEIESSTLIDIPGGGGSIEVPSLQEVVALDVTDKFRPVHPRPVLPSRVAIIGNYLPRNCGIATFTTDLCDAIHGEYAATELLALPVNDTEEGYDYPARIRFELSQDDLASYRQAADFLNFSNVDLVCLQHEYGIFGGPAGSHILELLRHLQMPVVTTLHTVLREPDPNQRAVMEQIAALSDRLIVMSQQSSEILQEVFHVPSCKIDLIPHGIPDLAFTDPTFYKLHADGILLYVQQDINHVNTKWLSTLSGKARYRTTEEKSRPGSFFVARNRGCPNLRPNPQRHLASARDGRSAGELPHLPHGGMACQTKANRYRRYGETGESFRFSGAGSGTGQIGRGARSSGQPEAVGRKQARVPMGNEESAG